jgi:hypothetical protein
MFFYARSPEWYINDPQEARKILHHLVKTGRSPSGLYPSFA